MDCTSCVHFDDVNDDDLMVRGECELGHKLVLCEDYYERED